jgi:serine/threonine protein kinase
MSLIPGTRIGSYNIVGKLGEGGMGEVYRARDSRLNRDVAIKVLPSLFADDPERGRDDRFPRTESVLRIRSVAARATGASCSTALAMI